mmetsp:Transcript_2473/g.3623  ORF Transcript_2473/g.3623 Transcript_2473/m.3623 type:complete len:81 (-) Transcript_2473:1482-1724(-)
MNHRNTDILPATDYKTIRLACSTPPPSPHTFNETPINHGPNPPITSLSSSTPKQALHETINNSLKTLAPAISGPLLCAKN